MLVSAWMAILTFLSWQKSELSDAGLLGASREVFYVEDAKLALAAGDHDSHRVSGAPPHQGSAYRRIKGNAAFGSIHLQRRNDEKRLLSPAFVLNNHAASGPDSAIFGRDLRLGFDGERYLEFVEPALDLTKFFLRHVPGQIVSILQLLLQPAGCRSLTLTEPSLLLANALSARRRKQ
jgi:hypothetical protein